MTRELASERRSPFSASPGRAARIVQTHPVIAAAERFLSIGGRLMISPHGRYVTAIDGALLLRDLPGVEERREIGRQFHEATRPKGSTQRLRAVIRKRGRPVNGWLVWGDIR
jgi:hypothetical protein